MGYTYARMRFQPWPLPHPTGNLQSLLTELIPERLVAKAATIGVAGSLDAPPAERRPNGVNYLHDLAGGRIVKPPPAAAWWAGLAASAVTRQRWCNPTLFLFAAGHYAEFAAVILGADHRMPATRRRDLVLHAASAIEPTPPKLGRDETVRRHIALGHDDLSARRAADWEFEMEPSPRIDRAVWSMSGSEVETLRAAWVAAQQAPLDMTDATIAACYLAAHGRIGKEGPNVPLPMRARIAANVIAASLQ